MNADEFTLSIRVYYEDTDFSGVVYHARHLHFFERGRTEALRTCGVSHTALLARPEPLAFVVRKMAIEWVAPARIDDLLEVATRFVEVRGARMLIGQTMRREGDLIARANVDAASKNLAGRPRRLPPDIAARLVAG